MDKIIERINYYNNSLERMQRLVKVYHDKKSKFEELQINEEISMLVLEAEIQQVKEFIEDLKYLSENNREG